MCSTWIDRGSLERQLVCGTSKEPHAARRVDGSGGELVDVMNDRKEPATKMWEADSIIELLAKLDLERLPTEESRAVSECQAKAVEDWISAYAESQTSDRVRASQGISA